MTDRKRIGPAPSDQTAIERKTVDYYVSEYHFEGKLTTDLAYFPAEATVQVMVSTRGPVAVQWAKMPHNVQARRTAAERIALLGQITITSPITAIVRWDRGQYRRVELELAPEQARAMLLLKELPNTLTVEAK